MTLGDIFEKNFGFSECIFLLLINIIIFFKIIYEKVLTYTSVYDII